MRFLPALAKPVPLALTAFALGTGAGAAMHAVLQARHDKPPAASEHVVQVPRVASLPRPVLPPPATSAIASTPIPVRASRRVAAADAERPNERAAMHPPDAGAEASRPSDDAFARDTDLAAERALIETARTALSRSDGQGALRVLDDHHRRFVRPMLAEEAEVLEIQALVATQGYKKARALADTFWSRFPHSLFLPIVEQAIRSIP